jgi:phosphoenolpyruvate carboxykinase (ATP)
MRNMLIRPTDEDLERDFSGEVDFNIFNAGINKLLLLSYR